MSNNNKNGDEQETQHFVLAAIFDLYFVEILIYFVTGVIFYITGSTSKIIIYLASGLNILLVLVYHMSQAEKVNILSFGERVTGRVLTGEQKIWENPYGINRWLFFVLGMILMILMRDTRALGGEFFTLGELIAYSIIIVTVFYSLATMGSGNVVGGYILAGAGVIASISFYLLTGMNYNTILTIAFTVLWIGLFVNFKEYRELQQAVSKED